MEGGGRTPGNKRKSNREELQVDQVRKEYAVTWQAVAEVVEACNGALEELEKCQVELVELEAKAIDLEEQTIVIKLQTEVNETFNNIAQKQKYWQQEMVLHKKVVEIQIKQNQADETNTAQAAKEVLQGTQRLLEEIPTTQYE
jgi:hypothetical protein